MEAPLDPHFPFPFPFQPPSTPLDLTFSVEFSQIKYIFFYVWESFSGEMRLRMRGATVRRKKNYPNCLTNLDGALTPTRGEENEKFMKIENEKLFIGGRFFFFFIPDPSDAPWVTEFSLSSPDFGVSRSRSYLAKVTHVPPMGRSTNRISSPKKTEKKQNKNQNRIRAAYGTWRNRNRQSI